LEEAEFCESIIMMHLGKIVVSGSPEKIRKRYADLPLFEIETPDPSRVFNLVESQPWVSEAAIMGGSVHVYAETNEPVALLEQFLKENRIETFSISKALPTLEDIFVKVTQND
jgi:ABC-type multidrug transport system ATPase subunit